jgi:hypothetical protein
MGVNEPGSHSKQFSSMVLKIEISGPDRSHFGILDIPGLYSNPRNNTSLARQEMLGVRRMVTSYMEKKENIIM